MWVSPDRVAPFGAPGPVSNSAVTVASASRLSWQAPVPLQAPLQPEKVAATSGVAVRVTTVPLVYCAEQSAPHSMPAGALVTTPLPLPVLVTVRVCCAVVAATKLAVTRWLASMVSTQLPVPPQSPLQPAKLLPAAGCTVSVTFTPGL